MRNRLCILMLVAATMGCGRNGATAPSPAPASTSTPTPTSTPAPASAPQTPSAFHFSAVVTDDAGNRVPGARYSLEVLRNDLTLIASGQALGLTDGAGAFSVDFAAIPGDTAFVWVSKAGYADEGDVRYILLTTREVSHSFLLHAPTRLSAGQSTTVTVSPDDPVCFNNGMDEEWGPLSSHWVCRAVRITVPADGVLTVSALANGTAQARVGLEIQSAGPTGNPWGCCTSTQSIQVSAGTEVAAFVLLGYGSPASQSFTLTTSLAPR